MVRSIDITLEGILRAIQVMQNPSNSVLDGLVHIIRPKPVDGHGTYGEPIWLCSRLNAPLTVGKAEWPHG